MGREGTHLMSGLGEDHLQLRGRKAGSEGIDGQGTPGAEQGGRPVVGNRARG